MPEMTRAEIRDSTRKNLERDFINAPDDYGRWEVFKRALEWAVASSELLEAQTYVR